MKYFGYICCLILFVTTAPAQTSPPPNYDETKVPAYTLPHLLKTNGNTIVTNKEQWERIRRPEILKLFEDNVYGQMPKDYDSLTFITTRYIDGAMSGKAVLKEVAISVFRKGRSMAIQLILFIPRSNKPSDVVLLINNRGKENTDPTRQTKSAFWPAEMIIDSGYAVAAFHVSDLAPDHKDSFMNAALRLYPEQLQKENGMRTIGAWAWGASRVMDYFQEEELINANKVILVGHSRGGKAALWASAQDQRFAMCVANNSGNSGAALSRRKFGETIAAINTAFPHWFTPNYKKYNRNEDALPVDQHMLIALTAPRPLYATSASEDLWGDPRGTFLSLKEAETVYALYGINPSLPRTVPPVNKPVGQTALAYHIRDGVHDLMEYDWQNFIRFVNRYFKKGF